MNISSTFSLASSYCHPISTQNYFNSPKMPVKDHSVALKQTKSSFKVQQKCLDDEVKSILQPRDINQSLQSQTILGGMKALKQLDLLKSKQLIITHHQGNDKSLNSCVHTRQTNPGYSRNSLGGLFTK